MGRRRRPTRRTARSRRSSSSRSCSRSTSDDGPARRSSTPTCTASGSGATRPSARRRTPATRPRWKRSPRPTRSTNSSRWPSSNWPASIQGEGDLVKAREIALAGMKAFPESPGGKLCFNLFRRSRPSQSAVTTERVWAEPLPNINVIVQEHHEGLLPRGEGRLRRAPEEGPVAAGAARPERGAGAARNWSRC